MRKFVVCSCAGNAGNVFPSPTSKEIASQRPRHVSRQCVSHVPWCMSGSLTRGGRENVSGISDACVTQQFYVSGKRPMGTVSCRCHLCPKLPDSDRRMVRDGFLLVAILHWKTYIQKEGSCIWYRSDRMICWQVMNTWWGSVLGGWISIMIYDCIYLYIYIYQILTYEGRLVGT